MSEIERHARALELARRIVTAQGRTDDDPRIHDARDVARAYIDRMEPVNERERQEIKESHEALRAQCKALSAALEMARKALRQISSACVFTDVRRCSQRFVHQYDWCSGCISSAALAALDAATTKPPTKSE